MRFGETVGGLLDAGYRRFVEVSAHPVLTSAIEDVVDEHPERPEVIVTGSLQRDHGDLRQMLTSAARLWAHGTDITWPTPTPTAPTSSSTECVELPTYPFQRQSYWLDAADEPLNLTSTGLTPQEHPFLGAALDLPEGGHLFTGSISLEAHPWLADHSVADVPLLPGAAFAQLALHVGNELDCPRVDELTLQAPLLLPEADAVQVHITADAPDEGGSRVVTFQSRATSAEASETVWVRHATATVSPDQASPPDDDASWLPVDAIPINTDSFYKTVASHGIVYGPEFQGLQSAWRHEDDVYAEVRLAENRDAAFGLHPALLDAALHTIFLTDSHPLGVSNDGPVGESGGPQVPLPFSWGGVSWYGECSGVLRVRLSVTGPSSYSVAISDENGRAIATVESLSVRPIALDQIEQASRRVEVPFQVEWVPAPARDHSDRPSSSESPTSWAVLGDGVGEWSGPVEGAGPDVPVYSDLAGLLRQVSDGSLGSAESSGSAESVGTVGSVPGVVVCPVGGLEVSSSPARAAHRVARRVLDVVRGWLGEERLSGSRLVLVTRGAVAAGGGEGVPDVAAATCWGLVRSAQSENPGRLVLVDAEPGEGPVSWGSVAAAVAGAV
ncbi:polyketide synthase, partial [Streptomyces diacarni]